MPQHEFITKQLIDKGWSEDRKYCVTDEQGNEFLLFVLQFHWDILNLILH